MEKKRAVAASGNFKNTFQQVSSNCCSYVDSQFGLSLLKFTVFFSKSGVPHLRKVVCKSFLSPLTYFYGPNPCCDHVQLYNKRSITKIVLYFSKSKGKYTKCAEKH